MRQMSELMPEIARWASIRRYEPRPIPNDVLKRILDAARRAPSWANVQPWHFIAVKDKAMKSKLRQLAVGQRFIESADAVIVCCGDRSAWSKEQRIRQMKALSEALGQSFDEDRIKRSLDDPAYNPLLRGEDVLVARLYEQLSLAIAFMILQAKHEGVGSCIIGAFANEVTAINRELYTEVCSSLGIPKDAMILTLVTLGYPAEDPKPRPRKAFDEVVSLERYKNPFID